MGPPPPPPPSQEGQTLEQILAAVTTLQTGQSSLQTDIDALQVQVNAANAAAAANAQDTSLQVTHVCTLAMHVHQQPLCDMAM